jgi:hypothetical protein
MALHSSTTANGNNTKHLDDERTPLLGQRSVATTIVADQNDEESAAIASSIDKEPYIDPVRPQNIAGVISVLLLG